MKKSTLSLEITVGGVEYKYFGACYTQDAALKMSRNLREQGHLATSRYTPEGVLP